MAYDNSNSGAVFANDRKEKSTHPDRTGSGEITCPDCGVSFQFWISGWIKTASAQAKNAGQKFMSLAFTPKDAPVHAGKPSTDDDFDDDIPF